MPTSEHNTRKKRRRRRRRRRRRSGHDQPSFPSLFF